MTDPTYVEKRVRVKVYGTLPRKSPLLVPVPGVKRSRLRLHVLAAKAFEAMAEAVRADLGIELKLASAWRRHRWKSWEHYEETVTERYGSLKKGRRMLAYNSPHETGLAIDIGVGGLWPSSKTRRAQRNKPLHKWLVDNAYRYGWHPYKVEPWHWEYPVNLEAFRSGKVGDLSKAMKSIHSGQDEDDVLEDEEHHNLLDGEDDD